jgi:hypothetical protein
MVSYSSKIEQGRQFLRNLSSQAFLVFGVNQIAYIRPVQVMGRTAYGLHAADGSPLTVIDSLEGAIIAARQNDLEPVTLQ